MKPRFYYTRLNIKCCIRWANLVGKKKSFLNLHVPTEYQKVVVKKMFLFQKNTGKKIKIKIKKQ